MTKLSINKRGVLGRGKLAAAVEVVTDVVEDTSKKACLLWEAKENERLAREHKRYANQARRERDKAVARCAREGLNYYATAREAALWFRHHREEAKKASEEAATCRAMAKALA